MGEICESARNGQAVQDCSQALFAASYAGESDRASDGRQPPSSLPGVALERPLSAGETTRATINVDGTARQFLLHIPSSYDGQNPMPLMIVYNGTGGSPSQIEQLTQMSAEADAKGFIVAYPQGAGLLGTFNNKQFPYNGQTAGVSAVPGEADDVRFTRQLIDSLELGLPVDRSRVYLAGFSQGGSFAHLAGTVLSDRVAAIADVSGYMTGKEGAPTTPVSELSIHGTDDKFVPYRGTEGLGADAALKSALGDFATTALNIEQGKSPLCIAGVDLAAYLLQEAGVSFFEPQSYTTEFWKKVNGFESSQPATVTASNTTTVSYRNDSNGAEVEQITINNGQHCWPGSAEGIPLVGEVFPELNATDTIWQFCSRQRKSI